MMKRILLAALLIATLSVSSYAQSDWQTYRARTIAEIIAAHSGMTPQKPDLIVSADPFPSKTVVTYTGKHRPTREYQKYFIGIWAQSRNLPPENAGMLAEEYLFREKDTAYWIPVIKPLVPHLERELKEGDEIQIYYFFLGGYNEKTLREKKIDKTKETTRGTLPNEIEWVFAVEEFQKPYLNVASSEKAYITQALVDAIDKSLPSSGNTDFLIDPRQVKSKSRVIYTGDVRKVGDKKIQFLKIWLENRELPPQVIGLLQQEARFRENDKDYWLPVGKKILEDMAQQFAKGDSVTVHTILAGLVSQDHSLEWVFVVGEFTK